MMVLLFKNVKNFVNEDQLFAALEGSAASKLTQEEYDKLRRGVEAQGNLERLI